MSTDRRDFFSAALALGAAPALLQMLPEIARADADALDTTMDLDTYKFWTQSVRRPSLSFAQSGKLPVSRGAPEPTAMLYYSDSDGFMRAQDERLIAQLQPSGDVSVSVAMQTMRPAAAHIKTMRNSGSGSLRVDLRQAVPLRQLSDTLSWSSMATLSGTGDPAAEAYQKLAFDPKSTWGSSKLVPLVGGVGFWAWNMNVQPGKSRFAAMLSSISGILPGGTTPAGTPSVYGPVNQAFNVLGMGLPSIAGTALHVVDAIYGFLSSQGGGKPEPVFQFQDQMMFVTQDARQKYADRGVHLRGGTYVMVPNSTVDTLLTQNYKLLDAALVSKDTSDAQKDEAMPSTLPETSYAVIKVAVTPLSA